MKRIISLILSIIASVALTNMGSANTLTVDSKRLVEVIGVVDFPILEQAAQLRELSKVKKPITILLNSPGGSVSAGLTFIDAMNIAKARGARLDCVVGVLAASMAFNMLPHCDRRYALPNAKLLFHPMRLMTGQQGLTTEEMTLWAVQMRVTETALKDELVAMMGCERSWFESYYRLEYLWEARFLVAQTPRHWITLVTNVEGIDNLFTIQKQRSLFDFSFFGNDTYKDWTLPSPLRIVNCGDDSAC